MLPIAHGEPSAAASTDTGQLSPPARAAKGQSASDTTQLSPSKRQLPSFQVASTRKLEAVGTVQPGTLRTHKYGSSAMASGSYVIACASLQPPSPGAIYGGGGGGCGGEGGLGGGGGGNGGDGGGLGAWQDEVEPVPLTASLQPPHAMPAPVHARTRILYIVPHCKSSTLSSWCAPSGSKGTLSSSTR